MRVLHVGFGFRPWIVNGLIIYAETLMQAQAAAGDQVGYFFCARQLPLVRRPFLHRWRRDRVDMFELVNSRHVVGRHRGSPDPLRDLEDPATEIVFRRVLERFGPQIVHVHDLGGLPSSLLDIARSCGRPIVMSVHDYEPLCPTVKLVDAYDRICLRPDPGEMCAVCCADAPQDNSEDLESGPPCRGSMAPCAARPVDGPATRRSAPGARCWASGSPETRLKPPPAPAPAGGRRGPPRPTTSGAATSTSSA
jgi:hypothetical protein